jgi:Ca2+-binding EF-hand superfamily protein
MVRVFFILSLFSILLFGKNEKDIYETNCVKCHSKIPVSIDKYFYRYLLKYSSETEVKKAMFEFLKNPTKEKTIMAESFVTRFGIKKKTKLSDEKLIEALDIYWDKYQVFDKLK